MDQQNFKLLQEILEMPEEARIILEDSRRDRDLEDLFASTDEIFEHLDNPQG